MKCEKTIKWRWPHLLNSGGHYDGTTGGYMQLLRLEVNKF